MRCPFCMFEDTRVLETRETGEDITRRRRECQKCEKRFTTYEQVELTNIPIIKKDGRRVMFDRQKLIKSMQVACQKRPVTLEALEHIASKIESRLRNSSKKEIQSKQIGNYVMRELKKVDTVAYIRFASVYREFKDLESFKSELDQLNKTKVGN